MSTTFSVIIDWDDCLCQCNEYLINGINSRHGTDYKLSDITNWGPLGDPLLDNRFEAMSQPSFHAEAPMYPGAKTLIYELEKMGAEVFIMTAVPASQVSMRMERIMTEFPDMDPGNIIFGSRKDMVNADFLLDDAIHNIVNSPVKYPVLFRRPWNDRCTGLMAVSDFLGFLTLVRSAVFPEESKAHDGPLILVGPTGSGKTAIASALCSRPNFERVVSYTTRPKRGSEAEDEYIFTSNEAFNEQKMNGAFVETTSYGNNQYGCRKKDIDAILDERNIPVMVLDICGAVSVKHYYPNATLIFVERDKEECFKALLERKLGIQETVNRLASFDGEMRNKRFCDFSVRNNGAVSDAVKEIKDLLDK